MNTYAINSLYDSANSPQNEPSSVDIREQYQYGADSLGHLDIVGVQECSCHDQEVEQNGGFNNIDVLFAIWFSKEMHYQHNQSSETHEELQSNE